MKTALITNPKARRNRNGKDSTLTSEAENLGISVYKILDFNKLPDLATDMMATEPELVIISGGDGTVHAVISILAETIAEDRLPFIATLPHGTTNVTSLQVSLRKPDPRQLRALNQLVANGLTAENICKRRSICVANLSHQPPLHGFINAAGAVASATSRCQTDLNQKGWTGNVAVAMSLVKDLTKKLFSKDPEVGGLLAAIPMELKTDKKQHFEGDTLTVLISTLDRLVLGADPFWNTGNGALRITRVAKNPPEFFRNLYRILFGNKSKLPESHFQSFSADTLTLKVDGEILIDGEFYQASSQTPLKISSGPEFAFIRL